MFASIQVAQSLQHALNGLVGFIPNLLAFLVILLVGVVIARLVRAIVTRVLRKTPLDNALNSGQTARYIERLAPDASPSALIGAGVFWLIVVFVLSAAIGTLKIPAVTTFMSQVLGYLPNVLAAIVIFVIAAAIAAAAGTAAARLMGDTPTGKILGTAVPILLMGIGVFMVLNQLRIAPAIVQITYIALVGSVALAAALAFGLGGREVAAQWLDQAYAKGQHNREQEKQERQTAKQRGQAQTDQPRRPITETGTHTQGGSPHTR